MREKGMVSPPKAARMLELHLNTVYRWCELSVAGDPRAKLKGVKKKVSGRYEIPFSEVVRLKASQI